MRREKKGGMMGDESMEESMEVIREVKSKNGREGREVEVVSWKLEVCELVQGKKGRKEGRDREIMRGKKRSMSSSIGEEKEGRGGEGIIEKKTANKDFKVKMKGSILIFLPIFNYK